VEKVHVVGMEDHVEVYLPFAAVEMVEIVVESLRGGECQLVEQLQLIVAILGLQALN
jgi:hypothetical protein